MAQIGLERKKSRWPLVIGLIVAALIIWALIALMGDGNDDAVVAETATVSGTLPTPVDTIDLPPVAVETAEPLTTAADATDRAIEPVETPAESPGP